MWPVLTTLRLPDGREFPITTYGVLMLVAAALCAVVSALRSRRFGFWPMDGLHLSVLAVAGGLIGSRILYILFNLKRVMAAPWQTVGLEGGLVWYGGLLGGGLAVIWYARGFAIPLPALFDFCAPTVALGHAVGRVGCFLVGCCYGKPTSVAFGVRFPPSQFYSGPAGVAVHPVQLYEAAFELAVASALFAWGNRPRQGRVLGVYLIAYAPFRLAMELFFRGDDRGSVGLMVPPSALVSAAMAACGLYLFFKFPRGSVAATASR